MKKSILVLLLGIIVNSIYAQKSSVAILEIKSVGLEQTSDVITDVIRFEIEKSNKYNLMEKEEMEYQMMMKKLNGENCFNKLCIMFTGKTLLVDKVLTGAVSKLGDNKLITLKLYDMETEMVEISKKIEVISDQDQTINEIINAAIKEFHTNEETIITKDIRKSQQSIEITSEKEEEEEKTTNGKVMYYNGVEFNESDILHSYPKLAIISRPTTLLEPITKIQFGAQYSFNELIALKGSFGYSFESNNNGFGGINGNNNNNIHWGYETRQELMIRIPSGLNTYNSDKNNYVRYYVSFEAAYRKRKHKEILISEFDYNIGTLTYTSDRYTSKLYMAHLKAGMQVVISNRIYVDPYVGLGIKIFRYNNEPNTQGQFYGYNTYDREIPNVTAGFDIGILIK